MPAATKGGACWRFFSNYCCTLPPLIPARATSWRKNSNWFKPLLWYCFYTKQYQRRGIGEKSRCRGPVSLRFFAIFALKTKLFWSSYTIQKERPYNLRPIPDLKKIIFSLRHHNVKLFWTKVGDFSPMPLLLGLMLAHSKKIKCHLG